MNRREYYYGEQQHVDIRFARPVALIKGLGTGD